MTARAAYERPWSCTVMQRVKGEDSGANTAEGGPSPPKKLRLSPVRDSSRYEAQSSHAELCLLLHNNSKACDVVVGPAQKSPGCQSIAHRLGTQWGQCCRLRADICHALTDGQTSRGCGVEGGICYRHARER